MAQIRNRYDIKNQIEEEFQVKQLPNFFSTNDEIKPLNGIILSILTHVVLFFLLGIFSFFFGLVFPQLPKPELPIQDVEFKLVQNESKPPINKNTKIRSDRDSQAGGKHDPKRAVSQPSPISSKPSKPSVEKKPQTKPAPKKQVQQPIKPQPVVQKPSKPTPAKPASPAKAPVKPAVAPSAVNKPMAPKIATAPKSPFNIPAPPSNAPVGSTYKPSTGTPNKTTGNTGSSGNAPAPKFSATSGQSAPATSGNKSYATRGSSGGYSTGGNPSPGNPSGRPGIDAIKQPNWGPYMRDLEQRIKRNWTPPKGDSSKRVVITFTIGRDGRLLSHKITKSSGMQLADRAAMSAIEATAPFRFYDSR